MKTGAKIAIVGIFAAGIGATLLYFFVFKKDYKKELLEMVNPNQKEYYRIILNKMNNQELKDMYEYTKLVLTKGKIDKSLDDRITILGVKYKISG